MTATAESTMVVIRHEVKDADLWREKFETHGSLFQTQGTSKIYLGACGHDKVVTVCMTSDLDRFLAVFNDTATTEAQANDGITGGVELYIIDETYIPSAD